MPKIEIRKFFDSGLRGVHVCVWLEPLDAVIKIQNFLTNLQVH